MKSTVFGGEEYVSIIDRADFIPAEFDDKWDLTFRKSFFDLCAEWTVGTSIRCMERSGETNYLHVASSTDNVCSSHVDAGAGGLRQMTIGPRCSVGNIRHEIGHESVEASIRVRGAKYL